MLISIRHAGGTVPLNIPAVVISYNVRFGHESTHCGLCGQLAYALGDHPDSSRVWRPDVRVIPVESRWISQPLRCHDDDDDYDDCWQQLLLWLICGKLSSWPQTASGDDDEPSNPTDDLENDTRRWDVSASWWLCKAFQQSSNLRYTGIYEINKTLLPCIKPRTTCAWKHKN